MAKPQLDDFKHIAIIQTAFLGDVVLAMPLVRVIKKNYPDIKISFVSTPLAAGITSSVKDIDSVISYDKRGIRKGLDGIKHIAGYLRENGVDCIISSHRSLRTSLLTFFTKAKYSVGFNTSAFSFAYKKRIKYIKSAHEIERNLALLKLLQIMILWIWIGAIYKRILVIMIRHMLSLSLPPFLRNMTKSLLWLPVRFGKLKNGKRNILSVWLLC